MASLHSMNFMLSSHHNLINIPSNNILAQNINLLIRTNSNRLKFSISGIRASHHQTLTNFNHQIFSISGIRASYTNINLRTLTNSNHPIFSISGIRATYRNTNLQTLRNKATIDDLITQREEQENRDKLILDELITIAEVVADRAEMHAIIGTQRNNWNQLLTNSINLFTLIASLMSGLSSLRIAGDLTIAPHFVAFKMASIVLFSIVTGMMVIVNRVQPSQLAEEQRKATQLWRQLGRTIRDDISRREATEFDVENAMKRVVALERAYPLPITGMLAKFPERVEASVWWPRTVIVKQKERDDVFMLERNGWDEEIETELKGLLRVLKAKDEGEYVKMGNVMLNLNKILASSGPILAGIAAISCWFIGTTGFGTAPIVLSVLAGSMAALVNTLEHGGQVGMVFEMFRNCAGYYRQLEEEIERNLGEKDVEKRENGELFRVKVALSLGRGLCELKDFAKYASLGCKDEDIGEFAGKLF